MTAEQSSPCIKLMEQLGNKTIICSVFFLDIVEYSKKSVAGQISLKERFNAFLSIAIRDVPNNDRIILDTGDGAAITFLGDVEDALRAALSMRDSLLNKNADDEPQLLVRMGINLGPVRLVKDINGLPNIVGDGINVAQRVMGFAQPGQILVSRSYYDAVSRLSQEYAGMFHFGGARTDKHVREHEVYAIGYPGDLPEADSTSDTMGKTITRQQGWQLWRANFTLRCHLLISQMRNAWERTPANKRGLYAGLAGVPLLLLLLLIIKLAHHQEPMPTAANPIANNTGSTQTTITSPTAQSATANTQKSPTVAHEHKAANKRKHENKVTPHEKKKDTPESATMGTVYVTVGPWGDVYLDDKWIGVSPPLTKLQVKPGLHIVELRNTTFPAHRQTIKIDAGKKVSISYKFAN